MNLGARFSLKARTASLWSAVWKFSPSRLRESGSTVAEIERIQALMAIFEAERLPGRYINELSDAGPDITRESYGDAKLQRLRALKRVWDPDNVFRRNHNVEP